MFRKADAPYPFRVSAAVPVMLPLPLSVRTAAFETVTVFWLTAPAPWRFNAPPLSAMAVLPIAPLMLVVPALRLVLPV